MNRSFVFDVIDMDCDERYVVRDWSEVDGCVELVLLSSSDEELSVSPPMDKQQLIDLKESIDIALKMMEE